MNGILERITHYKSGKGAFLTIGGVDYMFFGSPSVKVGDKATFDLGKPSKDGKPTIRAIRPDGIEAFAINNKEGEPITRIEPTTKDSREGYWASKEKSDAEQKPVITMLSCISSACDLYSGAQGDEDKVLAAAEKMFQLAMKKKVQP